MGSKGRIISGLIILGLGFLVLCISSSTAIHDFIVGSITGLSP